MSPTTNANAQANVGDVILVFFQNRSQPGQSVEIHVSHPLCFLSENFQVKGQFAAITFCDGILSKMAVVCRRSIPYKKDLELCISMYCIRVLVHSTLLAC